MFVTWLDLLLQAGGNTEKVLHLLLPDKWLGAGTWKAEQRISPPNAGPGLCCFAGSDQQAEWNQDQALDLLSGPVDR